MNMYFLLWDGFTVPAHAEEVSISNASDTYINVDIEQSTYSDGVLVEVFVAIETCVCIQWIACTYVV